jgi:hypothetical protein
LTYLVEVVFGREFGREQEGTTVVLVSWLVHTTRVLGRPQLYIGVENNATHDLPMTRHAIVNDEPDHSEKKTIS